jgi:hypothetical protein
MDEDVGLRFKQDYTTAFNYSLVAYSIDRRSLRDIFPPSGQVARLIYRHTPLDDDPGQQLFASAIAYFPGIANHHGFRLYAAIQREKSAYYNFGSYLSMPRGQSVFFSGNLQGLKLDYAFPLAYPDHRIGPLVYTKRLRSNLFYDMLVAADDLYSSMGFEVWADAHLLRMQAPVGIGLRLSYNLPQQKIVPEFIFGIDWNSIY